MLSEGGRGIDRQVWVRIWIPLLSSPEWLVACQLALANPLNVTMTELPAHAAWPADSQRVRVAQPHIDG